MAFDSYGSTQSSSGEKKSDVDFDALNKYVVETAGLQQQETLVGFVSGIVDLGIQEQPDAENKYTGKKEDEAAEIAKFPNTYFKDGKDDKGNPCRLKCYPQKAVQSVAIAVDFPDITLDKEQFFGESKPLPLRIWMGGQFYIPTKGMMIARTTPLRVNKKMGAWSMDALSLPYKMAVAAKIVAPGEVFLPQQIDSLLGKSMQFVVQVYMKEGKGGKEYYTEFIKYAAPLARGQKEFDMSEYTPFLIQFNSKNDEKALQELRFHIINTLKQATNFEGSMIQKQLLEIGKIKPEEGRGQQGGSEGDDEDFVPEVKGEPSVPPKPAAKKAPAKVVEPVDDPDDDDIPF